jgi:hypothetical protein
VRLADDKFVAFFAPRPGRWLNHLMIEQADIPAATTVKLAKAGRVVSGEVRASLQAVRQAQEVARAHARRQTRQARLWLAAVLGVVVAAAFAIGPRLMRGRHARARAAVPAVALASPTPAPAEAPIAAPVAAPAEPVAPTPAPVEPVAPKVVASSAATTASASAPSVQPEAARDGTERRTDCDPAFIQKAPWLLSPEACMQAFALDAKNAPLALAIAHGEHVRGHFAEGATWAKRALALDPKIAEAYVLIARAEMADGHAEEARVAYRHYLDLAPHGWHRTEARTGVRRVRTKLSQD